jgi:hypothetical protein
VFLCCSPSFLLLSVLSFTRETQFVGDSPVQYNPLVVSTSLRRTNGHLPAHGRLCGQSMRCVSSAPFFPTSIRTFFSFLSGFDLDIYYGLCAPRTPCRRLGAAAMSCLTSRCVRSWLRRGLRQLRGARGLLAVSMCLDVLCTWAACAPTGAQSISFCLLHFYGLHWP